MKYFFFDEKLLNGVPKLYETENIPIEDKVAHIKFFSPYSNWTWYVVEAEKQKNGDILFFGLVS